MIFFLKCDNIQVFDTILYNIKDNIYMTYHLFELLIILNLINLLIVYCIIKKIIILIYVEIPNLYLNIF